MGLRRKKWIVEGEIVVIDEGGYYELKEMNGRGMKEGIERGNGRVEEVEIDI